MILLSGCAVLPASKATCRSSSQTDSDTLQRRLLLATVQTNFNDCVTGASMAFSEATLSALSALDGDIEESMATLRTALKEQGEESDGYIARYRRGEAQVIAESQSLVTQCLDREVAPAIDAFIAAYQDDLADLEEGLCVNVSGKLLLRNPSPGSSERDRWAREMACVLRPNRGFAMKLLDDGFEWVPIAGDAWGYLKIVYDPRSKARDSNIDHLVTALHSNLVSNIVTPLKTRLPDAHSIEMICRMAFSPASAVEIYLNSEERNDTNE
jgi:hypothetical protein